MFLDFLPGSQGPGSNKAVQVTLRSVDTLDTRVTKTARTRNTAPLCQPFHLSYQNNKFTINNARWGVSYPGSQSGLPVDEECGPISKVSQSWTKMTPSLIGDLYGVTAVHTLCANWR